LKCIFEYHGCQVHGCKSCYLNRDELDLYDRNTHEENYQNTLIKKQFCLEQGYKYIEIWYCEWLKIQNDYTQYIIDIKHYLNLNKKGIINNYDEINELERELEALQKQ
jgi:hypothetical protein